MATEAAALTTVSPAEPTVIQVLLVEHEPDDARRIQAMLESAGAEYFQVVTRSKLREAHAYLDQVGADLIVLDLDNSEAQGLETLRELQAQAPQSPVILLTGHGQDSLGLEAIRLGAQDHMVKWEFDAAKLARAIGHAVQRKRGLLERERMLEAEREERRVAQALGRIGLALSATLELDNLVELICKESVQLFDVAAAFVWLVRGDQLVGRGGYGRLLDKFVGTTLPLDDPQALSARVIRERRPIFVNWAKDSEGVDRELVERFEVHAILGVPLLKGLNPIGALMIIDSKRPDRFGVNDLEIGTVLGSHVAVAVENARLYEQERRMAQMKDDFIAHVSHELRTPLHTLKGFIDMVRSGKVVDPAVQRDFLSRASHDADRLAEQVSELLDAAQIDASGLQLDYHPVDATAVIVQTLDSLQVMASDRGVTLQAELPEHASNIQTEERRLRQVVRNLVENAIQFSERGCTVRVTCQVASERMRLTVQDQGAGIPAEALDRLFDRFYQVETGSRREKGGVGLGLYITRMIVEAHGGEISVESELGSGTTFEVRMPTSPHTQSEELTR